MNEKFALHFRIYTRLPFDDQGMAESLCKKFVDWGGDFVPTNYDASEPVRQKFKSDDLSKPAVLLSETFYNLILKRTKPRWEAFFCWHRNRIRPWFWTFSFGEEWLKDACLEQITDFLADLCVEFPPVFAVGGLSTDWFDKHDVMDTHTGKFRERAGASFNPGTGLPGIYWFNYFGKELVAYFGHSNLLQLNGIVTDYGKSNGVRVLTYETPEQQNSDWRRAQERKVVETLGEQYFFDLVKAAGKRPRRREPIPGATDAKSLRG